MLRLHGQVGLASLLVGLRMVLFPLPMGQSVGSPHALRPRQARVDELAVVQGWMIENAPYRC